MSKVTEGGSASPRMPNGLNEVYDALCQEVTFLHATCKIFLQLFGHSEKRADLLHMMLPDFSSVIFDVLRNEIVMSLSRLTDPRCVAGRENLCLRRLTEHLKKAQFGDLLADIERRVKVIEERCKPFRDWRNRQLAHHDWPVAPTYARGPLPGIDREQLEEALGMIADLLNRVLGHFEDSEIRFAGVLLRADGETLVTYLEEVEEHRNARLRKYLGEAGPP